MTGTNRLFVKIFEEKIKRLVLLASAIASINCGNATEKLIVYVEDLINGSYNNPIGGSKFQLPNMMGMKGNICNKDGLMRRYKDAKKNFNTTNVTDMTYMFVKCTNLSSVYFNKDCFLSNLVDMKGMLRHCTNLKYLDLPALYEKQKEQIHDEINKSGSSFLEPLD